MKNKGSQFDAVNAANKLETETGYTIDPRTNKDVTSGISVAPRGNEVQKSPATPADIAEYHMANADRFESNKTYMMGGWRDSSGTDYLDTPNVHPITPGGGGEARARRQMVLSNQEAGFNITKFRETGDPDVATIRNPFHPKSRAESGKAPHELADAGQPREGDTLAQAKKRSEWVASQPEAQAWINSPRQRSTDPE